MITSGVIPSISKYLYLATHFRNGYELVRACRGGPPCEKAVRWNGCEFVHPTGRYGLVETILDLWKDRCYTRRDFYEPADGDCVIDAGAHVGLFSIATALSNPRCRIIAVEPSHENFECLRQNVRSWGLSNILTIPFALGGDQITAFMKRADESSIKNQVCHFPSRGTRPVHVISLARILRQLGKGRIAFLKMTVEGGEYDVFEATNAATLNRIDRLAVEYHDHLRPGTLSLLRTKLRLTHDVQVKPSHGSDYGLLLAKHRSLVQ